MAEPDTGVPPGFTVLPLRGAGFIDANGPLYGKREDGRFVLGIRIEPRHCNPAGRCHGGMLATIADMLLAMGSNIQAELSSLLFTVTLNCDFLSAAPSGCWLEGRVEVLRVTRTLVFSQGLLTVDGEPVLRASAVLKRPSKPSTNYNSTLRLP